MCDFGLLIPSIYFLAMQCVAVDEVGSEKRILGRSSERKEHSYNRSELTAVRNIRNEGGNFEIPHFSGLILSIGSLFYYFSHFRELNHNFRSEDFRWSYRKTWRKSSVRTIFIRTWMKLSFETRIPAIQGSTVYTNSRFTISSSVERFFC